MVENELREKREYVRALISVRAKIERIEDSEIDRLRSCKSTSHFFLTDLFRKNTPGKTLAEECGLDRFSEFLVRIDEKLERILQILEEDQIDADNTVEVKETIDISGSGIGIRLYEPLEVGQFCRVSLKIPGFPHGVFKTCGQVVRVTPRKKQKEQFYDIGIKFLDISEEEREMLIALTFDQQRKTLRKPPPNT